MPSPHKKSFAAEQLARQKKKSPVVWVLAVIVVVAVIVGGYVVYRRSVQEKVETETQQIKSIAVLPFVDMSSNKDQEWFCDGIADAILSKLTLVGEIKVPASTSSFSFKGKDTSIIDIGFYFSSLKKNNKTQKNTGVMDNFFVYSFPTLRRTIWSQLFSNIVPDN